MARTTVIAGTATAVAGGVHHHQQQKWAGEAEQGAPAPAPQPAVAPAPQAAEPDMAGELQQLAQLHAQGILTDEEFAAKKAQILGI